MYIGNILAQYSTTKIEKNMHQNKKKLKCYSGKSGKAKMVAIIKKNGVMSVQEV